MITNLQITQIYPGNRHKKHQYFHITLEDSKGNKYRTQFSCFPNFTNAIDKALKRIKPSQLPKEESNADK